MDICIDTLNSESAATLSQLSLAQLSPQRLAGFSEIIDARSPAEFAEDHIPGAINLPVLDDEERARIGTLHKQASAFAAKKAGAALVSRHIADYLEDHFSAKPIGYKPLVYCWRGGNRSGSLVHVLQRIGFKTEQLDGGYKAFRRLVVSELNTMPQQFDFIVICGPTGCGKSRLLQALRAQGAQVLDLEELAAHRGSLLGSLPDQPQPGQKKLETGIWWELRHFDPARPVFVESESKKIGNLHLPDSLMAAIRGGRSLWLDASLEQRVQLLLEEYEHYLRWPEQLQERLQHLEELRGRETLERWAEMIRLGEWAEFVRDMLENHYDPAYRKSLGRNYRQAPDFAETHRVFALRGIRDEDYALLAAGILAGKTSPAC